MKALILTLALVAAPAVAQAVKDQPAVTLDPAKAYLYYDANKFGTALKLIREATDADRAAYAAKRAEMFAKAKKRYERNHADWVAASKAAAGSSSLPKPGPEPVEPKDDTFSIGPIEMDLMVDIGPFNRFTKAGDTSSYLWAIPPGTYRVYGPVMLNPQGAPMGTCLCMGSVKFDVAPGMITDMGTMVLPFYDAVQSAKGGAGEKPKTALDLPEGQTSFAIEPAKAGDPIDPRVASFPARPAAYRASGRMPNYFGVEIDRLQAIPGVLRYDRDKIIDAASGQEVK